MDNKGSIKKIKGARLNFERQKFQPGISEMGIAVAYLFFLKFNIRTEKFQVDVLRNVE